MTDMTTAWPPYAAPSGLWFNTTDSDAAGTVVAGGTFKFDTTADFGLYLLNGTDGSLLRSDLWTGAVDGVFWVKLSGDGTLAAAGGWQNTGGGVYQGRLRAIRVSDGAVLVDQQTGSRVNQIAMTPDGRWMAAGCGATYSGSGQQIYLYELVDGVYQALGGYTNSAVSIQTLAMSDDGKWIIAGLYGSPSVILFQNIDRMLVVYASWTIPAGTGADAGAEDAALDVRRTVLEHRAALQSRQALGSEPASGSSGAYTKFVSITPDGAAMAAVLSGTNGVAYFTRANFIANKTPDWTFVPANISTSSNVSIAADGSFLVMGSNGNSSLGAKVGVVCRVDNHGTSGSLAWTSPVEYFPNPCNHMLACNDQLLGFGTGEPDGSALTPGRYYVLNAADGTILGRFKTDQMNWPFQLSADGQAAIGGSDDGNMYGFNARGNWDNAI